MNNDTVKNFLNSIKVKDVMLSPAPKVFEDDELSAAEEIFVNHTTDYVAVLSRDNKLVGLVSHKYIYKTQSPRKFVDPHAKFDPDLAADPDLLIEDDSFYSKGTLDRFILRNIMNKNPVTLDPNQSVGEAITAMNRNNIGAVAIQDKDNKVLGLLTTRELVAFLASTVTS